MKFRFIDTETGKIVKDNVECSNEHDAMIIAAEQGLIAQLIN